MELKNFSEVFELDTKEKGVLNAKGGESKIQVFERGEDEDLIPEINSEYVFDPVNTKNVLMGLAMNYPVYIWGNAGVGKTTLVEQICARTNRPLIRVQHTANMEESHVLGQWVVRNGSMVFEFGLLALAMKHGWVYLADEYDFANPAVIALYQPVLEGKPLVIKEADHENRVIKPHKNFKFVATANTNGSGDESGLYQGTNVLNSANLDRFHVVIEVPYLSEAKEIEVLTSQTKVSQEEAKSLVRIASLIRENYNNGRICSPISTRTLLSIAKIGLAKVSFADAFEICFSNKLPRIDKQVVNDTVRKVLGS